MHWIFLLWRFKYLMHDNDVRNVLNERIHIFSQTYQNSVKNFFKIFEIKNVLSESLIWLQNSLNF